MQKNNTKEVLIEVRKSYRLLYQYQKRVLDLVDYIGKKFGLTYNGGYPKFSSVSPRNGGGILTNWAWDWLNMYYYEFHFNNLKVGDDTLYFSIFLLNDNGFFKANNETKISKTSVSKFTDIHESESELIFVIGKNLWDGWGFNWDEPEFLLKEFGEKRKDENRFMIFKHYSLELFDEESRALGCIKDFETICHKNDVKFKILETKIV